LGFQTSELNRLGRRGVILKKIKEPKYKWKIAAFSFAMCLGVLVFAILYNKGGVDWLKAKVQTTVEMTPSPEPSVAKPQTFTLTKDIINFSWSPNHESVVYSKYEALQGKVYLWRKDEEEAIFVGNTDAEDRSSVFIWTPDSEHLLVDNGTSSDRGGYLISVKDLQKKEVHYYSKVYFSPDSRRMLFSDWINIQSSYKKDIQDGYSYNLSVLNLDTYDVTVVMEPTDTTDFIAAGWLDNSTIKYIKKDYSKKTEESLEADFDKKTT
jgi:hypothetical protein